LKPNQHKPVDYGFTLPELIVVVAITAVIAAVTIPGVAQLLSSRSMENMARRAGDDALFARSEAIKRNMPVIFCAGSDLTCVSNPSASSWGQGWLVCYDQNSDGVCDAGNSTDPNPLRVQIPSSTDFIMTGPAARLQFNADGTITGASAPTFAVSAAGAPTSRWSVRLASSGAIAVRREAL